MSGLKPALLLVLALLPAAAIAATPDIATLKTAAERGEPYPPCQLGEKYRTGDGAPQSDAEAAKWYALCAQRGNMNGDYYMGLFYKNGQGVPKDFVLAYAYFLVTSETGNIRARAELAEIAEKLTPQQILEAKRRARSLTKPGLWRQTLGQRPRENPLPQKRMSTADQKRVCYKEFPDSEHGSNLWTATVNACSELLRSDPANPLPYYFRASAHYMTPVKNWNAPPYYNSSVGATVQTSVQSIIEDYENALKYENAASQAVLPDRAKVYLDLGYAYASVMEWAKARARWQRAIDLNPALSVELTERIAFVHDRMREKAEVLRQSPKECAQLSYWACGLVKGCSTVIGASWCAGPGPDAVCSADLAYKGCIRVPVSSTGPAKQ